jgi:hypothetical protein
MDSPCLLVRQTNDQPLPELDAETRAMLSKYYTDLHEAHWKAIFDQYEQKLEMPFSDIDNTDLESLFSNPF